jgi:hypothetical protein
LPRQREQHGLLFDSQKAAGGHCAGGRGAGRLTSKRIFAHKISVTQSVENRFLAGVRSDTEFHPSFLNDEQGISGISLSIDCFSLSNDSILFPGPAVLRKAPGLKVALGWAIGRSVPCSGHLQIKHTDGGEEAHYGSLLEGKSGHG